MARKNEYSIYRFTMKIRLIILVISLQITACSQKQRTFIHEKPEWQEFFSSRGVVGTFVLFNLNSNDYYIYNYERAKEQFLPASTFKIPNSIIALETGVLSSPDDIIHWDGIDRGMENWNRDQSLAEAFHNSTVWVYQELARRIGEEKMEFWIKESDYGNENINGGIDLFWLQGDLRISAMEQINFLKKLVKNELPFSISNQLLVKEMMMIENKYGVKLYGKTGWAARVKPQTGWFTGFVQRGSDTWIFAMNIIIENNDQIRFRKEITYDILCKEGIISIEE